MALASRSAGATSPGEDGTDERPCVSSGLFQSDWGLCGSCSGGTPERDLTGRSVRRAVERLCARCGTADCMRPAASDSIRKRLWPGVEPVAQGLCPCRFKDLLA